MSILETVINIKTCSNKLPDARDGLCCLLSPFMAGFNIVLKFVRSSIFVSVLGYSFLSGKRSQLCS